MFEQYIIQLYSSHSDRSLKFALRAVRLKRKCDTIDMPSPAITRPFQDDRSLLQHYSRQVKQLETDVRNEIMRNNKFGFVYIQWLFNAFSKSICIYSTSAQHNN